MDRFIVGTGRCGSTLLSRMLAEGPDTLSVFEFFNGLDATRRFAGEPVPGADFADLICAEQPFVTAVLRRGYAVAEITYPFGPGARYDRDDALPWILVSMLPRLSSDPDALCDDVVAFCRSLPPQAMPEHCRDLFEMLSARFGRRCWIERSGSSIDYLADLRAVFPGARFLHIHRDGREAALSMREHHAYRLPIALMYQPSGSPTDTAQILTSLRADPTPEDPISRILSSRPPVAYYGRYWSDQVLRGARAWPDLGADRYLEIRFEDLVREPHELLTRIRDFFEIETSDDGWIDRAATLVRGVPPTRFESLSDEEQEILQDACAPGRERLAQSD